MLTDPQRVADVVRQIEDAFGDMEHPGLGHVVASQDPLDWESVSIASDFGGAHWRDIPASTVRKHWIALVLLTPEAYRFYLPAYMRAGLTLEDRAGRGDIQEATIGSLAPIPLKDKPGRGEQLFQERIALLTDAQKDAVRAFLALMREHYLPRPALDPNGIWRRK